MHLTARARERLGQNGADGAVIVARESKGRKGAGVTLIRGLPLADKELKALAKKLKARCGVGGRLEYGANWVVKSAPPVWAKPADPAGMANNPSAAVETSMTVGCSEIVPIAANA